MSLGDDFHKRVIPKEHEYVEKSKTLCVTGPRPNRLLGYVPSELYIPLIKGMEEHILYFYDLGYRKYICGGAQGIDQLFYLAVMDTCKEHGIIDIVKSVYVPFYGQEDRWADTGTFSKQEYYMMIESADEVRVISPDIRSGSPYREMCSAYDLRNKAMLNSSSRLLAWPSEGRTGGTANCIRDAEQMGIPIHYLNQRINYEKK